MSDSSPDIISIRYNGIDITDHVELKKTTFRTGVNAVPGPCLIRVKDIAHDQVFVTGKNLSLDVNGQRKWDGFLTQIKRGYYFTGLRDGSVDETARFIELIGTDVNILFEKRFLVDPLNPTQVELKQFPAGTADDVVLTYYMQNYLDLRDDFITRFAIEHVGTPAIDCADNHDCIGGNAGWSWGDFFREMTRNIGSIFYIDPDRAVIHTDTDTPTALVGISDVPGPGEIGCQNLEIEYGGEDLRNDAMIWGAGQGTDHIVFSRVTDATSISEHGLWQYGDFRPSIFRQATTDKIANSAVYGSPQHKRGGKDDRVSARCRVFDHRLRAAQKVRLRSEVHGYDDVLPIRAVDITFPTAEHVAYDLQLSQEIDPIWSTFEFFFPQFDVHRNLISLPSSHITIQTIATQGPGGPAVAGTDGIKCIQNQVYWDDWAWKVDPSAPRGSIDLFAMRYAHPTVNNPVILGPLGYNTYLIDGDVNTYLVGYFAWARGTIEMAFDIPISIDAVIIEQCIGVPQADDDMWWTVDWIHGAHNYVPPSGWRHMSDQIQISYSDNGTIFTPVGSSPTPSGYNYSGYSTISADTGIPEPHRWWNVSSTHSLAEWVSMPRGEYGWGWWINNIYVIGSCQTVIGTPSSEGTNPYSYVDTIPETTTTVSGSPGARCFDVGNSYLEGSSQLFIGGLFQRPGLDYYEYPKLGKFCINDAIDLTNKTIWFGAIFIPVLKGGA